MSRASTYIYDETRFIPTEYPMGFEPVKTWSETLNADQTTIPKVEFDGWYFNKLARSVEAAVYQIKEQFAQRPFASMSLTHVSSYIWEQMEPNLEQDIWVDMPPLSTEKVVMHVQDIGFGEPLAMLDLLPEE